MGPHVLLCLRAGQRSGTVHSTGEYTEPVPACERTIKLGQVMFLKSKSWFVVRWSCCVAPWSL